MNRRQFLGRAVTVGGVALVGSSVLASQQFQVTRVQTTLPKLRNPLRLAHLSDLHFGPLFKSQHVRAWVEASNAARPDVVVITGDFIQGQTKLGQQYDTQDFAALAAALSGLQAPLGVYGVLGNHDYMLPNNGTVLVEDLVQQLEGAGVQMLTNTGKNLRSDVYLCGVDDLWESQPNLEAALAHHDPNTACVLLSHNPDFLPNVPERVGLMLSGHTHGGQVRLPGMGALFSVTQYGERYQQGFVTEKTRAFVSRGLGGSVPVRVLCNAEIVVFEFSAP